jgi:hypothetical protein
LIAVNDGRSVNTEILFKYNSPGKKDPGRIQKRWKDTFLM